ncbi:MarR family winged helix-turn-helix transcriptional regulator [Phaeocystidibacter luteus]|uniref:MarR family transcriptional regulator n=1 Tax=Phaeocystidibacter luteus TaxID=911197 RepID=A0A6N6RK44_9FLAO|nr:MarR family transcriptional regulator [Phaeocystidibacter luteus]KAB2808691.1 MarR family transcriptional regulator [Phaeocystidibacter luteus]
MAKHKATVDQLGYVLGRIHRRIRANVELRRPELKEAHQFETMILLRILQQRGGTIPQSEITEYMPMLDRHRISRLSVAMEDSGFITRTPNPNNRRENILHATESGKKHVEEFVIAAREANQHIFNGLSHEQVDTLFDTLQHILKNLEDHTNTTP